MYNQSDIAVLMGFEGHNIVGKIRHFAISFDSILMLDENMNDARITGLSADIVRGLDMIEWYHFLESTSKGIAW
jgi:hypothetical protein